MLKNLKRFAAAALFAACAIGTSANAYAQKINPIQIIDKGFVLLTRTTFLLVV